MSVAREHGAMVMVHAENEDAIEFLLAGATAVGVGTALFYAPLVLPKINQGILAYLDRHELAHVGQISGALRLNSPEGTALCAC